MVFSAVSLQDAAAKREAQAHMAREVASLSATVYKSGYSKAVGKN